MQCSAFTAILESQNICLSFLFFLLPSGSERVPSFVHFLDVLFSPGYLVLHQFALLKQETAMERVVCQGFGVSAGDIKTGQSPNITKFYI